MLNLSDAISPLPLPPLIDVDEKVDLKFEFYATQKKKMFVALVRVSLCCTHKEKRRKTKKESYHYLHTLYVNSFLGDSRLCVNSFDHYKTKGLVWEELCRFLGYHRLSRKYTIVI
jgi:hypothetical protein